MSVASIPASEAVHGLTGYDELAIHAVTGKSIPELARGSENIFLRVVAAVYLAHTAEGAPLVIQPRDLTPHYEATMGMSLKDMDSFFAKEPDDVMPEAPESDAGKGA